MTDGFRQVRGRDEPDVLQPAGRRKRRWSWRLLEGHWAGEGTLQELQERLSS